MHAVVDGAPGTISGTMRFQPDPAGCMLGAQPTADLDDDGLLAAERDPVLLAGGDCGWR